MGQFPIAYSPLAIVYSLFPIAYSLLAIAPTRAVMFGIVRATRCRPMSASFAKVTPAMMETNSGELFSKSPCHEGTIAIHPKKGQ